MILCVAFVNSGVRMTVAEKNVRAMALAALGFSLYSIGDVFIKMASEFYHPAQVGFWSNLSWIPMLLLFGRYAGGFKRTLASKKIHLHVARAFLGMVSFYFMTHGFHELGMATSYTLIFAAPFIATILSIFFLGEKIRIYRWCAIAAGFTGVLVVLRPGVVPLEPAALGILFGACCYATSTILIRKIGEQEPLLAFSFYSVVACIVTFGTITISKGNSLLPAPEHMWFFLATAFFQIFANFATSRAFSSGETSTVAPFHYIQLLWGILFGYTIFNQGIDLWTAAGGFIIVASGIYMIHREHVRRREMTHGVVAAGTALE